MTKSTKPIIVIVVIVSIFSTAISKLVKAILVDYDFSETIKFLITVSVAGIICALIAFVAIKLIDLIFPKWLKSWRKELKSKSTDE